LLLPQLECLLVLLLGFKSLTCTAQSLYCAMASLKAGVACSTSSGVQASIEEPPQELSIRQWGLPVPGADGARNNRQPRRNFPPSRTSIHPPEVSTKVLGSGKTGEEFSAIESRANSPGPPPAPRFPTRTKATPYSIAPKPARPRHQNILQDHPPGPSSGIS
jgi:hypothetical protein